MSILNESSKLYKNSLINEEKPSRILRDKTKKLFLAKNLPALEDFLLKGGYPLEFKPIKTYSYGGYSVKPYENYVDNAIYEMFRLKPSLINKIQDKESREYVANEVKELNNSKGRKAYISLSNKDKGAFEGNGRDVKYPTAFKHEYEENHEPGKKAMKMFPWKYNNSKKNYDKLGDNSILFRNKDFKASAYEYISDLKSIVFKRIVELTKKGLSKSDIEFYIRRDLTNNELKSDPETNAAFKKAFNDKKIKKIIKMVSYRRPKVKRLNDGTKEYWSKMYDQYGEEYTDAYADALEAQRDAYGDDARENYFGY